MDYMRQSIQQATKKDIEGYKKWIGKLYTAVLGSSLNIKLILEQTWIQRLVEIHSSRLQMHWSG
jgi:hypothetical protein